MREAEEKRHAKADKLRKQEIELQRNQLDLQCDRDKREQEKQGNIASPVKWYGSTLAKFPHDSTEIPAYFDNVERLFLSYEVPNTIRVKLLLPYLSEKCRTLVARLKSDEIDDYPAVCQFLLNEFKLTPSQFEERFDKATKSHEETYILFCSRLRGLLTYYHRSRKVTDYKRLVSLMVADKIKSCLPTACHNFVLTAEKGDWLECDKLSEMVDTYYTSRPKLSSANEVSNSNVTNPKSWKQLKHFNASENASPISPSEAA